MIVDLHLCFRLELDARKSVGMSREQLKSKFINDTKFGEKKIGDKRNKEQESLNSQVDHNSPKIRSELDNHVNIETPKTDSEAGRTLAPADSKSVKLPTKLPHTSEIKLPNLTSWSAVNVTILKYPSGPLWTAPKNFKEFCGLSFNCFLYGDKKREGKAINSFSAVLMGQAGIRRFSTDWLNFQKGVRNPEQIWVS